MTRDVFAKMQETADSRHRLDAIGPDAKLALRSGPGRKRARTFDEPRSSDMLTWEAASALATAFSAIVIAVTVGLSVRQLRIAADQLSHVRRSTQLAGTMEMLNRFASAEMTAAMRFVGQELGARIDDADFAVGVELGYLADLRVHQEMIVLRGFEELRTYVKHGLLDGDVFYDSIGPRIVNSWNALGASDVISIHRATRGARLWENFEFLHAETKAFMSARGDDDLIEIKQKKKPDDVRPLR